MNIFTDDDVKRLKECLKKRWHVDIGACNGEAIDLTLLLARLEAAEYYLLHTLDGKPHCNNCERLVDTWRKAAGK